MKIRVLRDTFAKGVLLQSGKVVEVSDDDAKLLVAMGKAEHVAAEKSSKAKKPESAPAADGDLDSDGEV
jgi:hypothetical protein